MSKTDNTRIDLIVANDQHLYLKACDYKERQKWLVALASQKATNQTQTIITTPASLPNPLLMSGTDGLHDQSFKSNEGNDELAESTNSFNSSFQQHLSKQLS